MTQEEKVLPVASPWLAGMALLCSQLSLNIGAAVAKHLFPRIGVEGVTAYRVGIAAALMLLVFRPWRTPLTRKQVLNLAIYGSVIGLMNLLIYRAFAHIPLGIAVAIEVAGPLTVAVLSSHRPRDFVAVCLAVAGLYYLLPIHGHVDQLDPVGVAYAAGAAVCWALYIVFGKRVSLMPGGQTVAWAMLAASLFIVPIGVWHAGEVLLTPSYLLIGLAIAVMSSALPYTLEMFSMRTLSSRTFSMFSSAAPALSALAGMAVLGEHLSLAQWLAISAIVAASALTSLR